jgi:curved DNA-binding protein CbpA
MNLTIAESLNLLNLEAEYSLIQLKESYRREVKKWHPDLNPHLKTTETCQRLIIAYELLTTLLTAKGKHQTDGKEWTKYMNEKLPEWEQEFKDWWRKAYQKTCTNEPYAAMHLNSAIVNFRRGAIEPRPAWFEHCLFPDTPKQRTYYREHLLKIAPNQTFREEWARKYFALEFGEGRWVFYLPASRALLTTGGDR